MALCVKHADQRGLARIFIAKCNAMQGAGDEMSKSIGCKLQCSIGATALNHFATVCIADFNEKMGKKQVSIG